MTAPSAPRNVTTVEIASTYAVFEWSIPEFPNGVIQRYIVSLTSVRDNTVTTVNSLELTANVTGLSPFIIYRVEVSAETVEIGEGSSSFTITTRQDSKMSIFVLPMCILCNNILHTMLMTTNACVYV